MKLNLKYTALKVDEIEKAKGTSIENCISDITIANICLFIQKGLIDDNGVHGVSRNVALSKIDEYLAENDKEDLIIDIMEALISGGFLPKSLKPERLRTGIDKRMNEITQHSEMNGEL